MNDQELVNRRDFLGIGMGVLVSGVVAPALGGCSSLVKKKKANVLWIIADDLGYGDLSCYGCQDIQTPVLDGLAATATKCGRFYAMPVCTPSRAALLTGQDPQALKLESALVGSGGWSGTTPSAPSFFKSQGYATALIGKWHLGYSGESVPNARGFDEFFGFLGGALHYYNHTGRGEHGQIGSLQHNGTPVHQEGSHTTALFTDRAIAFVRGQSASETPFFLTLAYNAPHYSQGRKKGEELPLDTYLQPPQEVLKLYAQDPQNPTLRELYSALVHDMDQHIGRIVTALKETGQYDNTVIMFMSDNGADLGHGGNSGNLNGHKGTLTEGGIRAAMIVKPAGSQMSGRVCDQVWDIRDIFPTTTTLAGLKLKDSRVHGSDESPSLIGWHLGRRQDTPRHFKYGRERAVVFGKWKLHGRLGVDLIEKLSLYDLEDDPIESQDVSSQRPDIFRKLNDSWKKWYRPYAEARLQEAELALEDNRGQVERASTLPDGAEGDKAKAEAARGMEWAQNNIAEQKVWIEICSAVAP